MRKLSIGVAASLLIAGIAAAPASFAGSHAEAKKADDGKKSEKMMKADADKDGMMSKAEFMKAMEAKFDKMSKDGKMDTKQLDAFLAELMKSGM